MFHSFLRRLIVLSLVALSLFDPAASLPAAVIVLPAQAALDPVGIAHAYLAAQRLRYGFTEADIRNFTISAQYTDAHNGLTHIYLVQRWQGIEVFNGVFNLAIDRHGQVLFAGNRWVPHLGETVNTTRPALTALTAIERAATYLHLPLTHPLHTLELSNAQNQRTVFSAGSLSHDPIPVQLVYDTSGPQPRLAWELVLNIDAARWLDLRVDAETGGVLAENNWVVSEHWEPATPIEAAQPLGAAADAGGPATASLPVADGSSYKVYPQPVNSPDDTTPLPPADARITVTQPADALASPFGWHDTNGIVGSEFITTSGNNVWAYTDVDANNTPDPNSSPSGGAGLDFIFPLTLTLAPSTYRPAAVTNAFYWANIMHDVAYRYGFTEAAGNFQANNYGRGGTENDALLAEAQDGFNNNANFSTPVDGLRPRMQLGVWTYATPSRDSSLLNGFIGHEYGHGISRRLVGGPNIVTCLDNVESMDEGWSDWHALFITQRANEDFAAGRGFGMYVLNQPVNGVGIRPAKYSTDLAVNPYTYAHLGSMVAPHGVGFIWASMLYELNATLVARYGFNSDVYAPWHTGGNNLTNQLVIDSLKILPCSPGFVDAREALLTADVALTGGANQCTIWAAVAKRGLGYSATQGSTTDPINAIADGTAAFDLPPSCNALVAPPAQSVCQNTSALYPVQAGGLLTAPLTFTVTGQPLSTTALFSPNPVLSTPATTTLTLGNTSLAAPGLYPLTIASSGTTTSFVTSTLAVYAGTPSQPTLLTPINGITATSPMFKWAAVAGAASYELQVATDIGFSTIVYSISVTTPTVWTSLAGNTLYFWRVRAVNPCGLSPYSPVFRVMTTPLYCRAPNLTLTTGPAVSDTLVVTPTGTLLDLNVVLSGTHYWVGDLTFTLTHGLTNTVLVDRPVYPTTTWGCGNNDFNIELDDESLAGAVENQCATNPALYGRPTPNTALSVFDGLNLSGTWTITVRDNLAPWPGVLQQWCLAPTLADVPIAGLSAASTSPQSVFSPVNFNATLTAGSNVTYTWNFGDGLTSNATLSPTQTHTYATPGSYTAIVTATNNVSVVTATTSVSITNLAVAGLSAMNSSPQNVLLSVNFTATVVTGTNVAYLWNFGDGNSAVGAVATHVYTLAGNYTATVTATNSLNTLTATTSVSIAAGTVYGVALAPLAATQTGTLGSLVIYTMHVTNTGNISDTFSLSHSASVYTTTLPSSSGLLAAGAVTTFVVSVQVPPTAPDGQQAVVTITATSQGNSNVAASVALTITALWQRVYLPQVRK